MANHKKKRPINARAGCKLCKRWKINGAPPRERYRPSELRRLQPEPRVR